MSSSTSSDVDYLKIMVTGASAVAIDMFIFGENGINKSGVVVVSAAGGCFLGSMVGYAIPDMSSSLPIFLGNGKGLIQRTIEIGSGVAGGYAINKFGLKNNGYRNDIQNKLITFAVADIIGEYASDYLNSRPLSLLS